MSLGLGIPLQVSRLTHVRGQHPACFCTRPFACPHISHCARPGKYINQRLYWWGLLSVPCKLSFKRRLLGRGTASAAGLLVRSWHAGGEGGAALLYDWERGVLECVFEAGTGDDMATRTELDAEDENQRRVGGAVSGPRPGEPLTVRRRRCCKEG